MFFKNSFQNFTQTKKLISIKFLQKHIKFFKNQHINVLNYSSLINEYEINLHLLRIEFLYTKLKYSRSPAYDIVSGGAAAIFAGLLGFLVSEKFGIELADSGDFYYLFMYIVFISFSLNPLLNVFFYNESLFSIISLIPICNIYTTIISFFIFFLKK